MSHFSTIKTELRDRQALLGALRDLGHSPTEGYLQVRGYRGQTLEAQLAVLQPNGADIGFRLNPDTGSYELVTDLDLWNQAVPVERFVAQLSQSYALRTILAASAEAGFELREQTQQQDGTIELVVSRWA